MPDVNPNPNPDPNAKPDPNPDTNLNPDGTPKKEDNNKDDNFDIDGTFWQNKDKEEPKKEPVTDPNAISPAEQFSAYIKDIDFLDGNDITKLTEELQQGNTDSLNKMFSNVGQNVYRRSIMDMNKIVESKVAASVELAVNKATSKVDASQAVSEMHKQLDFTRKAAISPIAQAVLNQFMKQGLSVPDAIDKVKEFYSQVAKTSAKDLNLIVAPSDKPGARGFQNTNAPQIDDDGNEKEVDWEQVMKGN